MEVLRMPDRRDPFRSFRFRLEIDGIQQAGFSEATIPDSTSDVAEYKGRDRSNHCEKTSRPHQVWEYNPEVGRTDSMELYEKCASPWRMERYATPERTWL